MVISDVFFFKQKTAYEVRISDWSSDVCSSDLIRRDRGGTGHDGWGGTGALSPRSPAAQGAAAMNELHLTDRIPDVVHGTAEWTVTEQRQDERRVGKEGVRTCRYRWSRYH